MPLNITETASPSANNVVDVDLLRRFQLDREQLRQPDPDCYTNWLGVVTDARQFTKVSDLSGTIRPDIPNGGDGVYGGYPEYAALLLAIQEAIPERRFVCVELGAGWGPWVSAAGVIARRLQFNEVRLLAVEADSGKCQLLSEHMQRNGLLSPPIETRIVQAAVWPTDGEVFFGVRDSITDHGGAASSIDTGAIDYRGFSVQSSRTPALSLNTLCDGYGAIDFMHWDIQGAEAEIASASMSLLDQSVKRIFIGTHSRAVEGKLLEIFHEHQWDIDWFNGCNFRYDRTKANLVAMGTTDGNLSLINPRFFV